MEIDSGGQALDKAALYELRRKDQSGLIIGRPVQGFVSDPQAALELGSRFRNLLERDGDFQFIFSSLESCKDI